MNEIWHSANDRQLNDREQEILARIVQLYVLKATPVGSRALAKYIENDMKLSPATLRNVMADLEELEYISHPHTSAGRVPTDKGYRFYVDSIKGFTSIPDYDFNKVKQNISGQDSESIYKDVSKVLGMLSKFIGLVKIPGIIDCSVQKIEIIPLSSTRIIVLIALDSNVVKTISLEANVDIDVNLLGEVTRFLNDRISGRPLNFVRENFTEMIRDFEKKDTPIVRLFIDSLDKMLEQRSNYDRIVMAGTQNLLEYPEFEDVEKVRSVIELIENEDMIIHLLDQVEEPNGIKVLIGRELQNDILNDYSLVLTSYQMGSASGSIGLIGPKRMNYPRMISLVKAVADLLSKPS